MKTLALLLIILCASAYAHGTELDRQQALDIVGRLTPAVPHQEFEDARAIVMQDIGLFYDALDAQDETLIRDRTAQLERTLAMLGDIGGYTVEELPAGSDTTSLPQYFLLRGYVQDVREDIADGIGAEYTPPSDGEAEVEETGWFGRLLAWLKGLW